MYPELSSIWPLVIGMLVAAGVSFVLFLIFRQLALWYWRVNRIVELLESIDRRLAGPTTEGRGAELGQIGRPLPPEYRKEQGERRPWWHRGE